ncbi:Acetate CoA-transferase YdiF [Virgibacillus dokdonensis]|uniref:Acetate CoA-transferase YdiF n=3 Tax=Virgibacillus dokdonensis TaxID=302167 RepID=A0A2K9J6S0_9BACI|nr:Acetate CoA-transferase YdiF [Virgibacillus dokdonensis]
MKAHSVLLWRIVSRLEIVSSYVKIMKHKGVKEMKDNLQFMSAQEAVHLINTGDRVGIGGFIGTGVAEEIHMAIENKYIETNTPQNLTLIYAAGIGDGNGASKGLNHYAHEGLIKRVIGGHWGMAPRLAPLVEENKLEAYNLPQGVITQLIRESAAGHPRLISHVGLGTFVDPDWDGGKLNAVTTEDIVEKIQFDGQDYLAYKTLPIDVAILKGTTADEKGNISLEDEPLTLNVLSFAMNARNNGGKVIVQVEKVVRESSLNPKNVHIPHVLVDAIVVVENKENHMQTFGTQYNEAFIRSDLVVNDKKSIYPLNIRKVIARRSAKTLTQSMKVINYGIGVPEVVANVLSEEGQEDHFIPTIEPGIFGGTPVGGLDFGCSINPDAIIDESYMFDYYDGGGLDIAFLGLAQCDDKGNVNVSKFGPKIAGCGGFINITQNAKKLVFCGTFTAGGLKMEVCDGRLVILQEGKVKKFTSDVEQITFSGKVAKQNEKPVLYVTERAVFELRKNGLTLIEIAPGIDLERDVLAQMEFTPLISKDLTLMDKAIFKEGPMGLIYNRSEQDMGSDFLTK